MVIYIHTEDRLKKGENNMLNEEICKLRDKLNESIENNADYEEIYKLSVELDELIARYYKNEKKLCENKN